MTSGMAMTPQEHLTEVEAILESVDVDDYDAAEIDSLNLSAIAHGIAGLLQLQLFAAENTTFNVRGNKNG